MEPLKPVLSSLDGIISNLEGALSPTPAAAPAAQAGPGDGAGAAGPQKKKKKAKKAKVAAAPAVDPVHAQFLMCDLRVGRVESVGEHPEADGLFVLSVAYGRGEMRTVCAGLRGHVDEEVLKGRAVVTICNLKPRKLRGVMSEAMVLAGSVVSDGAKERVELLVAPGGALEGDIVQTEGIMGERSVAEGKFVSGKNWDKVVGRLGVKDGIACYDGQALMVNGRVVRCELPDGSEIH